MNKSSNKIRVGLLTPYTGGNLGDGAIQDAVISNIRKRYPDAEIFGINICPEDTAIRHKIQCVSIAAAPIEYYASQSGLNTQGKNVRKARGLLLRESFKEIIRKVNFLYLICKPIYRCISLLFRWSHRTVSEFKHITKSYNFLKEIDLLIASGGGQLDDYWGGPSGHPFSLFKWAIIAKKTNTRFIFLSVGVCAIKSKLSLFFIKNSLKLSDYRSYRDQTSKQLLRKLSFTHTDKVYPDLAFGYSPTIDKSIPNKKKRQNGKMIVGISPIAYLSQYGWPEKKLQVFNEYISKLAEFMEVLYGMNYMVMIFTSASADSKAAEEVISRLKINSNIIFDDFIIKPIIYTTDQLYRELMSVDLVVASRLHGIILSHLSNKPVLAISYDRKVKTYMAEMGQEKFCIDIREFNAKTILKKFKSLVINSSDIKKSIEKKANSYKRRIDYQYDSVFKIQK